MTENFRRIEYSLERTDRALLRKKRCLENDVSDLGLKRKDLLKEDRLLEGKNHALLRIKRGSG